MCLNWTDTLWEDDYDAVSLNLNKEGNTATTNQTNTYK